MGELFLVRVDDRDLGLRVGHEVVLQHRPSSVSLHAIPGLNRLLVASESSFFGASVASSEIEPTASQEGFVRT